MSSFTPIDTGTTDITPEEVGYNPARLGQLDAHFQKLIKDQKIQGASYLLSRHGKIFAYRSMGKLCYDNDTDRLMPDSIRKLYSLTKLFTAVAIMKLVEDGLLYLEQTVATIIEEFDTPVYNQINIFHLLTHTAGICPVTGYFGESYPDEREWWKEDNWIKAGLAGPVYASPGETWIYCTFGYVILGEIITRVTGIHGEEYIRRNILDPLSMNDTFFDIPENLLGRTCFVFDWEKEELYQKSATKQNRSPRTDGGLYSTLGDLWKFGQMILDGGIFNENRIISRKSLEYMTRNHLKPNTPAYHWGAKYQNFKHGLGFNLLLSELLSPGTFNHEGYGRSALYIDPVEKMLAAYFIPSTYDWISEAFINPRTIIWSGLL